MTEPDQFKRLEELRQAGILDEAEFSSAWARAVASQQLAPPPVYYPPPPLLPPPPYQRRRRGTRWPWILAAALGVLGVAAIVYGFSSSTSTNKNGATGPQIQSTAANTYFPPPAANSYFPTDTPSVPTQATVGDTLHYTDDKGVAADILVANLRKVTHRSEFSDPAKGTYWEADVTVTGLTGTWEINPFDFTTRSASGDAFNVQLGVVDNQLVDGQIAPGQKLKGAIVFDIARGQSIAYIVIEQGGTQLASWQVG